MAGPANNNEQSIPEDTGGVRWGRWQFPVLALVVPGRSWEGLRQDGSLLPAYTCQVLILFASWLVGAVPLRDLAEFSNFGYKFEVTAFSIIFTIIQSAIAVLAFNALLAFLLYIALQLLGSRQKFSQLFLFALVSLLPFVVGLLIGSVNLFFQRPLSNDVLVVAATYLKPFSLGLTSLFPASFPLLSLPWFLASYLDFFGIWSILLAFLGFRFFFRFDMQRALWATISFMLVLILLVTLLWQAVQTGLSSTLA